MIVILVAVNIGVWYSQITFSTPFDATIVVGVAVFLVVDLALDLIVVIVVFLLIIADPYFVLFNKCSSGTPEG